MNFEKLKFWKKKPSESKEVKTVTVEPEIRCFVAQIIKDLNPDDWNKWSHEKVSIFGSSICKRHDRKYELYVGDYMIYRKRYSIHVKDLNATIFTDDEAQAISDAYEKMLNARHAYESSIALKKDEEFLKENFPECYPSTVLDKPKTKKSNKK